MYEYCYSYVACTRSRILDILIELKRHDGSDNDNAGTDD